MSVVWHSTYIENINWRVVHDAVFIDQVRKT